MLCNNINVPYKKQNIKVIGIHKIVLNTDWIDFFYPYALSLLIQFFFYNCSKISQELCVCILGPSPPHSIQAQALSTSAIQVRWQPPENPNGGIIKYVIEYQPVGQGSPHHWLDIDDRNKTAKDVTSLNSSTLYQFRVRACSKVPGEWSTFVQERTHGDGKKEFALCLSWGWVAGL